MFQILVIILFIILVIVLPLRGLGPVVYKGLPIEDKHFTAVIDGGCVLANGYKTFYLNRRSGILIVKILSTALNNWKQQHFTVTIVIIITRSKPAYRWQGLGWDRGASIQFRRVHFGMFSMSRFVPPAPSSDWILLLICNFSDFWIFSPN